MADDLLAKMVWSFVGRAKDDGIDEDPEATIERCRTSLAAGRYPDGLDALAEEMGVPWPVDPNVLDASAWAGRARWALIQRDRAIRWAVAEGASKRSVAAATGMAPSAVDRVLERESAPNTRW